MKDLWGFYRDWYGTDDPTRLEYLRWKSEFTFPEFTDVLADQAEFSRETFGPGMRTGGVIAHIKSELEEIEEDPADLTEWIDVVILGLDGARRCGDHSPEEIYAALLDKMEKNRNRTWPDWRLSSEDEPIGHVKE